MNFRDFLRKGEDQTTDTFSAPVDSDNSDQSTDTPVAPVDEDDEN